MRAYSAWPLASTRCQRFEQTNREINPEGLFAGQGLSQRIGGMDMDRTAEYAVDDRGDDKFSAGNIGSYSLTIRVSGGEARTAPRTSGGHLSAARFRTTVLERSKSRAKGKVNYKCLDNESFAYLIYENGTLVTTIFAFSRSLGSCKPLKTLIAAYTPVQFQRYQELIMQTSTTAFLLLVTSACAAALESRDTVPTTNPIADFHVTFLGNQTASNSCSHRDLGFTGRLGGNWYSVFGDTP